MRTIFALAAAFALSATAASAAAARVSDVDYIRAQRCEALASSGLASADADAMRKFVKAEGNGRNTAVRQLAEDASAKAKRQARTDSAEKKAELLAELSGPCQAFKG